MTLPPHGVNMKLTYKVNFGVMGLEITYKTNRLKKVCTDFSVAQREYNLEMAQKIAHRMNQLIAADSIEMLIQFEFGRCHPLKGDRRGQFAMDLVHPYRLVFEEKDSQIQLVRILAIEDYH